MAQAVAEVYANLPDYEALIAAIAQRRLELNVSFKTLAEAASLQADFLSGALDPSVPAQERTRRLRWLSIFLLLPPLGLGLLFVEAPDLAARYDMPKRQANQARPDNLSRAPSKRTLSRALSYLGQNGAKARSAAQTPQQRSAHARNAAMKRWRKPNVKVSRRGIRRLRSTPMP
jgi:hypothetical protein